MKELCVEAADLRPGDLIVDPHVIWCLVEVNIENNRVTWRAVAHVGAPRLGWTTSKTSLYWVFRP